MDWYSSRRSQSSQCLLKCSRAHFSTTFDIKLDCWLVGSSIFLVPVCFDLIKGFMTAAYQFAQNFSLSNDILMTLVIAGIHISITLLSVDAFRMSSLHNLLGIWFMIVFRLASLIVETLLNLGIVSS